MSDYQYDGSIFDISDTTALGYTNGRGGDLTHTLKYDIELMSYYSYADSLFHPNMQYLQLFDGSNNIISNEQEFFATAWVPQTKNLYYYDVSNKMTSQIQQNWASAAGSWSPYSKDIYTYNPGTSLMFSDLYSLWVAGVDSFVGNSEKVYSYDVNSNQVQELDYVASGTTYLNSTRYVYTYNSMNQILTKVYDTWMSGNFVHTNRYSYTYDSLTSNLTAILYQTYDTTALSWINNSLQLFSNFSGMSPQTEEDKTWNDTLLGGSWQPWVEYTYGYNTNNQMTSKTKTSWNVTGFYEFAAGDIRTNYYYETVLNAVKNVENAAFQVSVFPVPAQNVLNINLSSADAQAYQIAIVDINGRIVRNWNIAATNKYSTVIPTDNFAIGNYFLKINTANGTTTKQFVVVR